jgi:hypothetical protein
MNQRFVRVPEVARSPITGKKKAASTESSALAAVTLAQNS